MERERELGYHDPTSIRTWLFANTGNSITKTANVRESLRNLSVLRYLAVSVYHVCNGGSHKETPYRIQTQERETSHKKIASITTPAWYSGAWYTIATDADMSVQLNRVDIVKPNASPHSHAKHSGARISAKERKKHFKIGRKIWNILLKSLNANCKMRLKSAIINPFNKNLVHLRTQWSCYNYTHFVKGLGGFQRLKTSTFLLFFLYIQWNILFKQVTI